VSALEKVVAWAAVAVATGWVGERRLWSSAMRSSAATRDITRVIGGGRRISKP